MRTLRWIFALTAVLTAASAWSQGYNRDLAVDPDVAFPRPEMKEIGLEQKLGNRVQWAAEFRDESGKKVRLQTLFGKRPVILLPIFYTCTGVCNLEMSGITEALILSEKLEVGRDVEVVALGIHPKETWELARAKEKQVLASYHKSKDPRGWHFLTGDMENIRAVTDSLGFKFSYDEAKNRVNHPSGIMVLTPNGIISSYLVGARYKPERLEKFVATAAAEEVGQKTQELFFGCIHIDPVTGKRSIVIEQVLRVFAAITMIAIVSTIVVLNVRSKRIRNGL